MTEEKDNPNVELQTKIEDALLEEFSTPMEYLQKRDEKGRLRTDWDNPHKRDRWIRLGDSTMVSFIAADFQRSMRSAKISEIVDIVMEALRDD